MSSPTHDPASSSLANTLLARLPADDYQRLCPTLTTITLRQKQILLKPHVPSDKIYFPGSGICSLTHETAAGHVAGVAIVGHEGMIGLTEFGGDPESGITTTVVIADTHAQVMDRDAFHSELSHRTRFHDLISRYARAFAASVMQSVACNALHPVEARYARCLLELQDRIGHDEVPATQDNLAEMLGVRRATVTLCAGHLHRLGLVTTRHTRVTILDRVGLQSAACECYQVIKGHFARLLP